MVRIAPLLLVLFTLACSGDPPTVSETSEVPAERTTDAAQNPEEVGPRAPQATREDATDDVSEDGVPEDIAGAGPVDDPSDAVNDAVTQGDDTDQPSEATQDGGAAADNEETNGSSTLADADTSEAEAEQDTAQQSAEDSVVEEDTTEVPDEQEEAPFQPLPMAATPADASPGNTRLRRLTKRELDNTIHDLLGLPRQLADSLPPDPETMGFDNNADAQPITSAWVERMARVAEQAASLAVEDLDTLLPCDPETTGELTCGQQFIDTVGRRALRRPLNNYQRALFLGLFSSARVSWGFKAGIRLTLEAMLQSPLFLYRVELGLPESEQQGVRRPTPHEMAARLSYLLWGTMPDEVLDARADMGGLVHPDDIAAEAQRMADDERAQRLVDSFHRQWFQTDRLLYLFNVYGDFQQLWAETRLFVQDVIFGLGGGGLDDLLTSHHSILDNTLINLYGAETSGPIVTSWILDDPLLSDQSTFKRVALDPEQRGGLLTQASFLSVNSNSTSPAKTIIKRGVFVLDKLLCQPIPSPPPDIPELESIDAGPNTTPVEMLALHTGDPACAGCHALVDPVGILFENYAASGAWRDTYGGIFPVEPTAEIFGTTVDGVYDSARDLIDALAADDSVAACYVEHWYRFGMGRAPEGADLEAVEDVVESFITNDTQVLDLLVDLSLVDANQFLRVEDDTEEDAP